MRPSNWILFPPIFGVNIKQNIWVATTQWSNWNPHPFHGLYIGVTILQLGSPNPKISPKSLWFQASWHHRIDPIVVLARLNVQVQDLNHRQQSVEILVACNGVHTKGSLFNGYMKPRDPYFMVSYNPYIPWVVFHPLYTLNNHGIFSMSHVDFEKPILGKKNINLPKFNSWNLKMLGVQKEFPLPRYHLQVLVLCYLVFFFFWGERGGG